jgi:hypothetical protein
MALNVSITSLILVIKKAKDASNGKDKLNNVRRFHTKETLALIQACTLRDPD